MNWFMQLVREYRETTAVKWFWTRERREQESLLSRTNGTTFVVKDAPAVLQSIGPQVLGECRELYDRSKGVE